MDIKEIGAKLRELRTNTGKTAEQVGREIGLSRACIYNYENAVRAVKADDFLNLLAYYGVRDVSKLFPEILMNYDVLTDKEWDLIEHYRQLPEQTKELIDKLTDISDSSAKSNRTTSTKPR